MKSKVINKFRLIVAFAILIMFFSAAKVSATPGAWSANGSQIYYMDGQVGIGWSSSGGASKLHIRQESNNSQMGDTVVAASQLVGSGNAAVSGNYKYVAFQVANSYNSAVNTGVGKNIGLEVYVAGGDKNYAAIFQNGFVGIGTENPTQMLSVNGTILAKEVIVSNASSYWPDYVFDADYSLMSLEELQNYINVNSHLPNIPNENEVEKNGVSLGEMQKLQMEKIEELTLYVLQLKEENEELKTQNSTLEERLDSIENILKININ